MERVQRIVLAASRPEPVGKAQKIRLVDGFQHVHDGLLDDFVLQAQDVQRPLRAVRLRNIGPFGRACAVTAPVYPAVQVFQLLFEVLFLVRIPRHTVDPRRGVPLKGAKALLQKIDGDVM